MKQQDKIDRNFRLVDEDNRIEWRELNVKDKIAYTMAVVLIFSGIAMAFLSFFLTEEHDVTNGVLMYVSEAFVTGGALLGIGIWVKGKIGEINSYIKNRLDNNE